MNSNRIKLASAVVGAGAVLAMGGLTLAVDDGGVARQAPVVAGADLKAADEDSTTTKQRGVPETSVAVPPITTPPFTIPTGEPQ
jgi:hypothetical protein